MGTMVYAPKIEVHIATATGVFYDVSDDISRSNIGRKTGISDASFVLTNAGRKWDGVFSPMDRVVIYLTRITRMLIFSGYLDSAPVFSTFTASVSLRASCSLKRLQHFMWDPHSVEANKVNGVASADDAKITDGGIAKRTVKTLHEVAGWPESQIHIGAVPANWYDRVSKVADTLVTQAEAASMIAAAGGAQIAGTSPIDGQSLDIDGIGVGTGTIPDGGVGKVSWFGGPAGAAYGGMALTGEPGGIPDDQRAKWGGPYYCAMRWGYARWNGHRVIPVTGAVPGAVGWWKDKKILVVSSLTHKAVCVRAADWGPGIDGRVIDLSLTALNALGNNQSMTDTNVHVSFAPAGMPLGPVAADYGKNAGGVVGSAIKVDHSAVKSADGEPAVLSSGWTRDGSDIVTIKVGKFSFGVARQAAPRFSGFVTELLKSGYKAEAIGGYRAGSTIKSPGGKESGRADNHSYGAAIDIDWYEMGNGFFTGNGPFKHKFVDAEIRPLAHKWGLFWGGDYEGVKDYMHFDVVGAPATPARAKDMVAKTISTAAVVVSGTPGAAPVSATTTSMGSGPTMTEAIFNAAQWLGNDDFSGDMLYGVRSLMNDVPIKPAIDELMSSGLREWCSAPNGDIIAWFPDYFGHWGTAAKMIIEDIEIEEPFSVDWSDDRLKTHMFVTSASGGGEGLGDATEVFRQSTTAGIASVEIPELMSALLNIDVKQFADGGVGFLNRFGARTHNEPMNIITGARTEFFFACFMFMKNWSEQWSSQISLTFMPELYPGMLAVFPRYGVQAYVESVDHSIDLSNGVGFTTQVSLKAWSTIGSQPSIKGLPLGGLL